VIYEHCRFFNVRFTLKSESISNITLARINNNNSNNDDGTLPVRVENPDEKSARRLAYDVTNRVNIVGSSSCRTDGRRARSIKRHRGPTARNPDFEPGHNLNLKADSTNGVCRGTIS